MQVMELAARGVAVIPCWPRTKRPRVRWQRYQQQLPTPGELARWFRPGRLPAHTNAAAVCGWQGLTVLDFDTLGGYAAWLAHACQRGGIAGDVAALTYRVLTARGVHVYVCCDAPAATGKLLIDGQHVGEVKATGYVLIPPSIHPSGAAYTAVDEGAPILRVPSLADVVPDAPARPQPKPAAPPLRYVAQTSALWPESEIDAIKRLVSIVELFPEAKPSGGNGRWYVTRCPWHDDESPSLRLDTQAGLAMCFAGCFDKPLDVIDAYARQHALTRRQAIRALAQRAGVLA